MPTLLLADPVGFPIALIRDLLVAQCPEIGWRVGEADTGGKHDQATLQRPQTILGRVRDGDLVLVSVEYHPLRHYAPANGHVPPPHEHYITISRPSTDDDALALKIALIVGATIGQQRPGAFLQLEPGGNWLDSGDLSTVLMLLSRKLDLAPVRTLGLPEGGASAAGPVPPPPPAPETKPKKPRLGSFTLLLDGAVQIDWATIDEAMNVIDAGGHWTSICVPGGLGFISGRTQITCIWAPMPYPQSDIDNCYGRSFWFDGDRARVARHRQYITLAIDAPDSFADKVATAKAVTILLGLIARLPQVAAVLNDTVGTIFSPQMTQQLVGILHSNEVPIQLWTWTAPTSLVDGDISLTTGGLKPFLGYEVEVWNAPHTRVVVLEKLNGVLRYLLINGPVINHGDTIGESGGDQRTRCFFGDSRADRVEPVRAMFVEIDGDPVARPRKDLPTPRPDPVPAPPPRPPSRGLTPRVGGFGRKGL